MKKKQRVQPKSSQKQQVSIPNELNPIKLNTLEVSPIITWDKVLIVPLSIVFILMTAMSFWFGITGDEVDMNNVGKAILNYIISFGKDDMILHLPKYIDRDQVLYLYGGFFDLLANIINKVSPLEEYTTRHLLNAWVGFLGIYYASRIAMLISGKRAAILCILIMFLSPYVIGQSMNNPKDIPFMTAFIAAIYYFMTTMYKSHSLKWQEYIPLIIAMTIAIDTRAAGLIIVPYMCVYLIMDYYFNKRNWKFIQKRLQIVGIVSIISYFAVSLIWPFAMQDPIHNPLNAVNALSHFKMDINQVYEGNKIGSKSLPIFYILKNFIISNHYILLIGLFLSPIFLLNKTKPKHFVDLLFLSFTVVFPILLIMQSHSNVYNVWRHILFVFPSASILAAFFWEKLIIEWDKPIIKFIPYSIMFIGLFIPLFFMIKNFPKFQSYYNDLVGGIKGAYGNYEMDCFYSGIKESVDWIKNNEKELLRNKDTIILGTNLVPMVREYFKNDKRVKVAWVKFQERSLRKWDYAIFHAELIPLYRIQSNNWKVTGTVQSSDIEGFPLSVTLKRISMDDYNSLLLLGKSNPSGVPLALRYLRLDPKNEIVNSALFQYYFNKQKLDSARQFLNVLTTVEPKSIMCRMNSGLMLLSSGKFGDALEIFNNLLKESPSFQPFHFYKGQALASLNQLDEALQEFEISTKTPLIRAPALQAIEQILRKQGKTEAANQMQLVH